MAEKITDKRMNITHKGLTYLPWSGHLWCRIIPTENSLGTPSLQQKRCSRPCAHPPPALLPAPARAPLCPSACSSPCYLPCLQAASLSRGFLFMLQTKGAGVVLAAGAGLPGAHSRCIGALTSAVSQLGQYRAVLSSPQDPYFCWKC